jgi:hypothetical protein
MAACNADTRVTLGDSPLREGLFCDPATWRPLASSDMICMNGTSHTGSAQIQSCILQLYNYGDMSLVTCKAQ